MFELDFNKVKDATGQSLSMDDRRFMAKVTEGIHHRPDSHYELPLPLRDESLALPNNKKLAFHRLQHVKLRFGRDEKYKKEYTAFMNDMIKKGYAEKISSLEETRQDGRIWYLPHHGVYHPQNETRSVLFSTAQQSTRVKLSTSIFFKARTSLTSWWEYYQGSDRNPLRSWQTLKQCFCKFMSLNVIETYCASCGGRTAT